MTGTVDTDLVVSGWSIASPYGFGPGPFGAGVRAGTVAVGPLDRGTWPGPYPTGGLIPKFDVAEALGRKGTRSMDRATGIAVVTVGMLLDACGAGLTADPQDVGLVLGTGSGSVQSIMDFTSESLTGEKPFYVDPARFPNTVMNRAAAASAIWHRLKGPNTTIAGGALTGLLALNYATRLLRCGRAKAILCGAVEEFSTQRGWLEWHGADYTPDGAGAGPLGEGCAIFLVEPAGSARAAGRRPVATVLGSRFGAFSAVTDAGPALARCVTEVLEHADTKPSDVDLVAAADPGGALGEQETAALDTAGLTAARVPCRQLVGDTSAASAAFQLAAVLAVAPDGGALALVTSIDRDGTTGCVLIRVADRPL